MRWCLRYDDEYIDDADVVYRLEENYEIAEGVCIPRSTLYIHYLDYCNNTDTQPVNAASFGKVSEWVVSIRLHCDIPPHSDCMQAL